MNQDLITELRKDYGMIYDDFYMVLTDVDMRVKVGALYSWGSKSGNGSSKVHLDTRCQDFFCLNLGVLIIFKILTADNKLRWQTW